MVKGFEVSKFRVFGFWGSGNGLWFQGFRVWGFGGLGEWQCAACDSLCSVVSKSTFMAPASKAQKNLNMHQRRRLPLYFGHRAPRRVARGGPELGSSSIVRFRC